MSFPLQVPQKCHQLFLPFPLFFLILLAVCVQGGETGAVFLKVVECVASLIFYRAADIVQTGPAPILAIIHSKLDMQGTGHRQLPRQVACPAQGPGGRSGQEPSKPF